jgi:AcrR family transcriptional regulator
MTVTVTGAGTLTSSQRARRQRMLAATLELAAEGGLDGVQMREVAEQADVALGTLYRYFPSKEHLVISAMAQSVLDLREALAAKPPRGDAPADRVTDVLGRANRFLTRRPKMTSAMIKALTAGDDVAEAVHEVTRIMSGIIVDAIAVDCEPADDHAEAADLLNYVWLSALISWVSGAQPADHVDAELARAARRLLR